MEERDPLEAALGDDCNAENFQERWKALEAQNPEYVEALLYTAGVVLGPRSAIRDPGLDPFTCSQCKKISTIKLMCCSLCKKQAYCDKNCQRVHWKMRHKGECVPVRELSKTEKKRIPLTWDQLEAFGVANKQKIEVRIYPPFEYPYQGDADYMSAWLYDRTLRARRALLPGTLYEEIQCLCERFQFPMLVWKNPKYVYRKHQFSDPADLDPQVAHWAVGPKIIPEDLDDIMLVGHMPHPWIDRGTAAGENTTSAVDIGKRKIVIHDAHNSSIFGDMAPLEVGGRPHPGTDKGTTLAEKISTPHTEKCSNVIPTAPRKESYHAISKYDILLLCMMAFAGILIIRSLVEVVQDFVVIIVAFAFLSAVANG